MPVTDNVVKNYKHIKTELINNFHMLIKGFVDCVTAFNYNFPKKNHPKKGGFSSFRSPIILEEELIDFV